MLLGALLASVARADEATATPATAVSPLAVPIDTATLVRTTATSGWIPGSPDPSGVAWMPGSDRLVVVDSEVDETTGAGWNNVNIWFSQRDGTVVGTGTAWGNNAALFDGDRGYSREPTGASFDPTGNVLFISDDSAKSVFVVRAGPDTVFGNTDDVVTAVDTEAIGSTDTEDPVYDPLSGDLFFLDGVGTEVYRVSPVDGVFGNGNDTVTHFDISHLGPTDFEGLARDPARGTLYVGARSTEQIFEVDQDGTHLRTIDASGITGLRFISGLEVAPSSTGSGQSNLFIVDRAIDNGANANENDGKLFEVSAPDVGGPVATVPGAPTDVVAAAGDGSAAVSWLAPVADGGSPVTGYVVTPFVGAMAQPPVVFSSTATTQSVTGLVNGTSYAFRVAAVNAMGTGPESEASNVVVPATVPEPPTGVVAVGGDGEVSVSWVAPVSDGGSPLTGYVVTPFVGLTAQTPVVFDPTALVGTVTGLENGTTYSFTVAAVNAVGAGALSAASNFATPAPLPVVVPGGAGIAEGNAGTTVLQVPVTLSAPSGVPVTVQWSTFDGSGQPAVGVDYDAASGTVTFEPGDTAEMVSVTVHGDTIDEPDEWLAVLFSNASNATVGGYYGLGFGVIVDDDLPPLVTPGAVGISPEGDAGSTFWNLPVTLSSPSGFPITVDWSTIDATGSGLAQSGADFVAGSGTVTFQPGETVQYISLEVLGDTVDEPPLLWGEWGLVGFSNPTKATIDTSTFFGVGLFIIVDDDP